MDKHTRFKKLILFDIDYTLFDPELFRNKSFHALAQAINYQNEEKFLQIAEEVYQESRKEIPYFDPKSYIPRLSARIKKSLNILVLEKIILQEKILELSLYKETIEVIEELSKEENIRLGIFSRGKIEVQEAKIALLKKFLLQEHIHIFELNKITALPEILTKYKEFTVYIIDDHPDVLIEAKKVEQNICAIWIKRDGSPERPILENFTPDSIISTLSELMPLIKKV